MYSSEKKKRRMEMVRRLNAYAKSAVTSQRFSMQYSVHKQNHNNESNLILLYQNLLNVVICGTFTYFIDKPHPSFGKLFETSTADFAVYAWLHFIQTINHNNVLCKSTL